MEAAARILEEGGHARFDTNAVAERAGVSIGTLYQYFPGKDALLGAVLQRTTSSMLEEVEDALALADPREALAAIVGAASRHQTARPALARLLDREEACLPDDAGTGLVRVRFEEHLAVVLKRLGVTPHPGGRIVAADVSSIIRGMIDDAGARGETDAVDLCRRVLRAVEGYLGI